MASAVATAVSNSDLVAEAALCSASFKPVAAAIIPGRPEASDFTILREAWNAHYFHSFARFDSLLKSYVDGGGTGYGQFVALSISHHNLHRLVEVIGLEIEASPLTETRIPERAQDLAEACRLLEQFIRESAAPAA